MKQKDCHQLGLHHWIVLRNWVILVGVDANCVVVTVRVTVATLPILVSFSISFSIISFIPLQKRRNNQKQKNHNSFDFFVHEGQK